MHRLAIHAIAVAVMILPAHAVTLTVAPDRVGPGDVTLLKIDSPVPAQAEASFLRETIELHAGAGHSLIAFIPIDIETPPGTYTIRVRQGNDYYTTRLRVRSRTFRTIKLTLPEEKVTLSPEDQQRVEREFVLQNNIWVQNTAPVWDGRFSSPLDTEVSTEFGVRRIMNGKKRSVHQGMDFRGKEGTPVRAINSGSVVLAQELFYGGNTLIIDHGMGLYSLYMHLSKIQASKGTHVQKGAVIGNVGMSGRATGPHLHLSVTLNGVSVNPESLFRLKL